MTVFQSLIQTLKRLKPEPDYGTVQITPFMILWLSCDDPTDEHEEKANQIEIPAPKKLPIVKVKGSTSGPNTFCATAQGAMEVRWITTGMGLI